LTTIETDAKIVEGFRFWFYDVGCNIVPAKSRRKEVFEPWKSYQTEPQTSELVERWLADGKFCDGLAVATGRLWRGVYAGRYLSVIDADNFKAIQEICSRNGKARSIEDFAAVTIVEQHDGNMNKAHVYIISEGRPLATKSSDTNNKEIADKLRSGEIPSFEVKATGKLVFCSPSYHIDGTRYQIIGTRTPTVLNVRQLQELEQHLNQIATKYGLRYLDSNNGSAALNKIPIGDLFKDGFVVAKGNNRHEALLRIAESLIRRNEGVVPLNDIKDLVRIENTRHCSPPLDDRNFAKVWHDAVNFIKLQDSLNSNVINNGNGHTEDNNKDKGKGEDRKDRKERLKGLFEELLSEFRFATLTDTREILYYDHYQDVYCERGDQVIERYLEHHIEDGDDPLSSYERSEIIKHIEINTFVDRTEFDKNPNLVHFKNGYLNTETFEFKRGNNPDYLSIKIVPHTYDPNAGCPKIAKFLRQVQTPQGVKTIVKILGYCLLNSCIYQKAFLFHGVGRNGKSVMLELIRAFLGVSNCSSASLRQLMDDDRQFATSSLFGKRANIFADTSKKYTDDFHLQDSSKLRALISGDFVEGEKKHRDAFSFRNKAKLIFSANHTITINDSEYADWRRWVLLKFHRTFDGASDDVGLLDRLVADEAEMSGLMNVAIQGLKFLKADKGFPEIQISEMQREYEEDTNVVKQFLSDRCVIDKHNKTLKTARDDLVADFVNYCKMWQKKQPDVDDLGSELISVYNLERSRGQVDHKKVWMYVGIAIKSDLNKAQMQIA
jgi:P4 family phage/plasmid primase-like protien